MTQPMKTGQAAAASQAPASKPKPTEPQAPPEAEKAPENTTQAPGKTAKAPKAKKPTLASVMDELLSRGTKTIPEGAAEAAGNAADGGIDPTGKDLKANVRARLAHYKKKGNPVAKDADGRLKLEASA